MILFLGTVSALADSVPVTYTGPNGVSAFGYYVGPAYGTVGGEAETLYCVDFANGVYNGQTWQANLSPLTGSLANTRYKNYSLYAQAAWLTSQYASQPTSEWGDIQATIWRLFLPATYPNLPKPSDAYWFMSAAAGVLSPSFDPRIYTIVTNPNPTPTGQVQEFIIDPPVQVPEPFSFELLGTCAVMGALVLWRRRSALQRAGSRN